MNNSTFQQEKQRFMMGLWPHKTIELSELQHVCENVYSLNGVELPADSAFTSSYDQTIGINSSQRSMVKKASGETGLTNYRNYINVAANLQKPKSVVIIASPESRQLTEIIPIVKEYISPTIFFDFAEMMAEETKYHISNVKFNNTVNPQITVIYTKPNARIHKFGPGEDFMMDGFYLAWTLSHVELGHYYERLVCSNGQTVREEHKDATVYKLSSNEIRKMIAQVKDKRFIAQGVEQFGKLFTVASTSRISLSEMGKAQKILIAQGIEKEQAETLIPYEETRSAYENAGYYDRHKNT